MTRNTATQQSEENKTAPAAASVADVQTKTETGAELTRNERDRVRSSTGGGSIMDVVTSTATNGNDHHTVAHSNFQNDVAANIAKNQKSIDDAWSRGTELSKEYGTLLALDKGALAKPENAARKAELEKQLTALKETVSGITGADHPIAAQFSQLLQTTQDREQSKAVADKLWSMTSEAQMFKGLKRGRELESAITEYKEQNKDLLGRSSAFAEAIKNQDQKAREVGTFARKNMEERYKEISESLDHWRPDKAEVAQKISSVGSQRNFELIKALYREQHPQKGRPELFDLVKDKCGANSDAARSFYSTRGEYKFAHRIDDERAQSLFTGVNEAEFSKDPRFAAAKAELERLRHAIETQKISISGNEKDAANRMKEYEEQTAPGLTNFWLTVSGARGSTLKMSEASQNLANQQMAARAQLERDLTEQTKRFEAMVSAEAAGRKLEEQGKLAEAQESYNKAQTTFIDFAKGSGRKMTVVTQEYAVQQNEALHQLASSQVIMDRSETALRATHKVCVVAGATVATIATAGAGAPLLTAALVGTGAGATIATTSNAVEGVGDVALGNKSVGDAAKYVVVESLKDTKSAAVAAVSTASGIGVAKYVRGGAESVSLLRSVAAGSAAGATAATVTTAVDSGGGRLVAEYGFSQEIKGKDLTPVAKQELKTKYMEDHGVSGKQILVSGGVNLVIGTISGGLGGGSTHVTQKIANAATKTVTSTLQQIGVRATEATANTGIALGAAYMMNGGNFDLDSTIQILGNAAIADRIGRSAATAPKAAAKSSTPAPAAGEPAAITPAPNTDSTLVVNTQQNGNSTTVTVGPRTTQPTVHVSTGEAAATTTVSQATTTAKITISQPEPAPTQTQAKTTATTQEGAPAPKADVTSQHTPQAPAVAPSQKETALVTKSTENAKLIEFQEKFIDYTKKLASEGKITPEQAENGIKDCNEKLSNLRKEQTELARDIESERTTQRLMAETRRMNQDRELKVKLDAEKARAEKATIEADFLEKQRISAAESQRIHKPKQDQVVAEARERMAARDNEVRRQVASRAEDKRAEIARSMNQAQAIAEGRFNPQPAPAPKAPPAASAQKPASTSSSGGSGSSSPTPGGGTREVMVAKITTEESLQRTADGRTVSVQKQKVVYVAEAEPEVSPQALKQRADLERMLNAKPAEAPKTKLTHAEEQTIYHDIEAKSSQAADELFVARRQANGKFLTKEDVLEVCAKYKIDPPESIQPKPAVKPEIEVTKAPKERETVEAKTQKHTELSDESVEANYFEIRQAAEHNQKLAAKLDKLHESGEFTANKVSKAFKDANEETPEIVLDKSKDSEFLPKPWTPDGEDSFSPTRDNRGGTATRERTETRVKPQTDTEVSTRARPAVESEEQTQTRVVTKPRIVEEQQTVSSRAKPVEETAAATRTTSKTANQTDTELTTQYKPIVPTPPKPPAPPHPPRRKKESDDGGGVGDWKLDELRRNKEDAHKFSHRPGDHKEKVQEHAVKEDWIEDKEGGGGHYERRGF